MVKPWQARFSRLPPSSKSGRAKPWEKYGLPPPKSEASKGELSLVDFEIYSGLEVPRKAFFVRLDGWCFHSLCRQLRLKKPYDRFLAEALVKTAQAFFVPFNPVLGYIFSDEINLLFTRPTSFRRVEKIDSVFAGLASSIFTNLLRKRYRKSLNAVFDCRVIPTGRAPIRKYLVWRQAEAFRNSNNSYAQFALMKRGLSARAAAKKLAGLDTRQLRALVEKEGIRLAKIPAWHERGIVLQWEEYQKAGFDPIKKKKVRVLRRRVKVDWAPPLFRSKEGREFLRKKL